MVLLEWDHSTITLNSRAISKAMAELCKYNKSSLPLNRSLVNFYFNKRGRYFRWIFWVVSDKKCVKNSRASRFIIIFPSYNQCKKQNARFRVMLDHIFKNSTGMDTTYRNSGPPLLFQKSLTYLSLKF